MLHMMFIQPRSHVTPNQLYNALKSRYSLLARPAIVISSSYVLSNRSFIDVCFVLLLFARVRCLPLVVFRSQVVSYGRDERMELCEECDGPHDVHSRRREDEGRSPDTGFCKLALWFLISAIDDFCAEIHSTNRRAGLELLSSRCCYQACVNEELVAVGKQLAGAIIAQPQRCACRQWRSEYGREHWWRAPTSGSHPWVRGSMPPRRRSR